MAARKIPHYAAKVDGAGRVLIPAALRRRCGLTPGTAVTLTADPSERITIRSRRAAVREAQDYFRRLRREDELWSEELIAERRAEAKREYGR